MASKSNKRRRLATALSSQGTNFPLGKLPSAVLEVVASYLAFPSRVLFAIAVTPPCNPYQTILGRCKSKKSRPSAIAGNQRDTLDFGEIEEELAAKLSDSDISDVLLHIDAVNKVKRLRLTNCTNITGVGLRPLNYSTSIDQIDLCLIGLHQSPRLQPEPPISCEVVLPMHAVNAGSLGAGNATKTLIFEHPKNAGFAREDAAQSALKRRK
jgi:hypothetical protein